MTQELIQSELESAVANDATFAASYPARPAPDSGSYNEGDFYGAVGHKLVINQSVLSYPKDFGLTFGAANITVTNKTGATWAIASKFVLELQLPGKPVYRTDEGANSRLVNRVSRADTFMINLGAPDVADPDGVCKSQSITSAAGGSIDGDLAVGGEVVFDVPRNVVGAWTGAAVMTVTGEDEYGKTVVESSAAGTSFTGKKALKKVTGVAVSANVTLATVGSGDVLGLPVFVPAAGHVLKELQDGAAASAGTIVAGAQTAGGSTATTGDVRGTYDPNAACDGDKQFSLIVSLPDSSYLGMAQYAG